ncbi:cytochrome P450 [Daedaleopsis nitida]|nr:cytochrome P450 [Daedaleopsis nitida]
MESRLQCLAIRPLRTGPERVGTRIGTSLVRCVAHTGAIATARIRQGESRTRYSCRLRSEHPLVSYCAGLNGAILAQTVVSSETFLPLVLYPNVQTRAQEEIDRVVGSERLPDNADYAQLPGYHMPAGVIVMGNVWGLLHDPCKIDPNPMEFRPERFLSDSVFDCSTDDPSHYAFGFDRRLDAQFLATFMISLPQSADPPPAEFTSEVFSRLLPFKCVIRPRSQAVVDVIEGAMASRN